MQQPSAFQIQAAMTAAATFAASIRETDPDIPEDDLALALDSETDVFDVLRRAVRASLDADASADAAGERLKALSERKARYLARKESTRNLAQAMLEALGLQKWEDPEFTISINRPRVKAIVTDVDALPELFVRVTRAADMATINAAIKAGNTVPGVEVGNGHTSITIRTR